MQMWVNSTGRLCRIQNFDKGGDEELMQRCGESISYGFYMLLVVGGEGG